MTGSSSRQIEMNSNSTMSSTQSNVVILYDEGQEDGGLSNGLSLDLANKAGLLNGLYPETEDDLVKAEQALSNELAKLSMNEQEEAIFDVVGLRNNKVEDEAFLSTKLAELDQHLRKISGRKARAYEAACKINPAYAQGRKFRLSFLRSQRFDPKKTAAVIINHFDLKRKVFSNYPPEIQGREVKFTDMSAYAQELMESGLIQVSPSTDAAGRPVVFFAKPPAMYNAPYNAPESKLEQKQALWYFWTCRSRNENAQRNGEVAVVYCGVHCERKFNVDIAVFIQKMKRAFPVDIQAVHFCGATMSTRFFVAAQRLFMDNFTRIRTQEHSGTYEEIDFALQTYGINADDSPMKPDDTFDTSFHKQWLEAQKQYDTNNSIQTILVPHRFDVLFGKSKQYRQHPGTMRCQLLVEMHWEEYDRKGKAERGLIAEKIVNTVHESGGRFLKWDGNCTTGGWKEVDDKAAREKVTHCFRGVRARKQKSQKEVNMSAPKRGIENGNGTDVIDSTAKVSGPTEVSDTSLFAKRLRAPGMDDISESLEA